MGSRTVRFAVFAIAAAVIGVAHIEAAGAATGDVLADIAAPAGGVSVAFDGTNVYYTDRNGVTLHSVSPGGAAQPSVPILGAPGINALAFDAPRNIFWAVDSTGLGIYRVSKDGVAMLQFALVPALDLPGLCAVATGCNPVVSGFAYDATDDTLWYAPAASERVYHLTTAGHLLGWFDTNGTAGSLFPDCIANGVGGLAAGKSTLYLAGNACSRGFSYAKSDTQSASKLSSFTLAARAPGDVECDDRSFSATVLWVRDTADGHLRAVVVGSGTCVFGGGVATSTSRGWMSGGGEAIGVSGDAEPDAPTFAVQHAFHILCGADADAPPNNLVINWKDLSGNHFSFHLRTIVRADCFIAGDPSPPPCVAPENQTEPPIECFNTITGQGTGRLRKRGPSGEVLISCSDCGGVEFTFQDNGEPNHALDVDGNKIATDHGDLTVFDAQRPSAPPLLVACGCTRANYQAHGQGNVP